MLELSHDAGNRGGLFRVAARLASFVPVNAQQARIQGRFVIMKTLQK